ncbi:MAG: GlsB/YeaQ/YmgE family stress response membrane protein [Myxococcales bacterium]|nr:GlsB/YeaQ/YmgE family stress response membrane protein [Myxococcales bacterium]
MSSVQEHGGALAGFIAAKITRDHGLGLLANIFVGVLGAFLGFWLLGLAGVSLAGIPGVLVTATIGAVVLLSVAGVVSHELRRRRSW